MERGFHRRRLATPLHTILKDKLPPFRRERNAAAAVTSSAAAGPSRPSFRPRPIDLAKALPIIKSSKDLRHEDDVVVNRALPTIATGVDPSEEEERHLQQALLASVFGSSQKPPDIPVPVVTTVKPPVYNSKFTLPDHYVVFDRTDAECLLETIEYDADYKDDAFARETDTPINNIELGMDALEKAQAHAETLMDYSTASPHLVHNLPNLPDSKRKELYQHWHQRRTQHKRPFLRIFQSPPDPNNTDPSVAFRPRDREGGATIAHRMNTLENYRRATALRDELVMLQQLLANVIDREKLKASMLSLRLLHQRINVAELAGPNLDTIIRYVFPAESEPVIIVPTQRNQQEPPNSSAPQATIPCRWLNLPENMKIDNVRLAVNKPVKKTRRRPKNSDKRMPRDTISVADTAERASTSLQQTVDTFGFDEYSNRFLKHMRCFSGGFSNYGVSPYDHRVFSAASERNTVRELPREPRAVNFPSSAVKFAHPVRRFRSGAKVRPRFITPNEIRQDIFSTSSPKTQSQIPPPKARPVIRVRGRVGRGGRVIFDRVSYERERGAKAASYPASVDMGGVYTAGIPLEEAKAVARQVPFGTMGNVELLAPPELDADALPDQYPMVDFAHQLAPPLKPMNEVAEGIGFGPDAINYWPRRDRRTNFHENEVPSDGVQSDVEMLDVVNDDKNVELVSNENIRRLPAYAPRPDLITQHVPE